MTSSRRPLSGWPALRTVLGTLVLILGLLGMHAGTGTSAAWAATGTAAATTVHHLGPGAIGPAGSAPAATFAGRAGAVAAGRAAAGGVEGHNPRSASSATTAIAPPITS